MADEDINISPAPDEQPQQGCGGCCGNTDGCDGRHHNCTSSCPRGKLHCFDWLADIPADATSPQLVEVQFKNTRKGFYLNADDLPIAIGDMVAVEASPGHDIGQVTLTGRLVELQMRKAGVKPDAELKKIFRIARPSDLEKYEKARARETDTMIRSRRIAEELGLAMKIGDVEYQGDGNKAIFYYIADDRIDFRKLIKILADTFKIRVEMKQIGARQEAGRIGGIGPCGRPLCCSSWMTNFVTVATSAARYQDLSLNPQKLAGQCAKLKCCLNFEVDAYVESIKSLPPRDVPLETQDATYFHFKTDIFRRELTYSTDKHIAANLVTLTADQVFDIIAMNKAGEKPVKLVEEDNAKAPHKKDFVDLVGQDSVTRFDKVKKKKKKRPSSGASNGNNDQVNRHKSDGNADTTSAQNGQGQRSNNRRRNRQQRGNQGGQRHNNDANNTPKQ